MSLGLPYYLQFFIELMANLPTNEQLSERNLYIHENHRLLIFEWFYILEEVVGNVMFCLAKIVNIAGSWSSLNMRYYIMRFQFQISIINEKCVIFVSDKEIVVQDDYVWQDEC